MKQYYIKYSDITGTLKDAVIVAESHEAAIKQLKSEVQIRTIEFCKLIKK